MLSHFDIIIGPLITHALQLANFRIPAKLPPDLKNQIQKLIEFQIDEGFFTHSYKTYTTANMYFKIPSEFTRGKKEKLCLSILTQSKRPELFKATLVAGVSRLKAIPDLYMAFYREQQIRDADIKKKQQDLKESLANLSQDKAFYHEKQINIDEVDKKRQELEKSLANLCQDVLNAEKQAIDKDDLSERDQTRDRERDQTRDRESHFESPK